MVALVMADQLPLLGEKPPAEPRLIHFDLETLRSADEVGGWNCVEKMGLACGVCFDSQDQRYHVYQEKDAQELIRHLRSADLVIGFNHIRFDYRVLAPYSTFNLQVLTSFDMLEDITRILGHRLKLDSLAQSTLGETKSADGFQSLQWVKEGRMDLVIEYCKRDVEVTKKLFEFGAKHGYVTFEKNLKPVRVPVNWSPHSILNSRKEKSASTPL